MTTSTKKRIIVSLIVCGMVILIAILLWYHCYEVYKVVTMFLGGCYTGIQCSKLINWICKDKDDNTVLEAIKKMSLDEMVDFIFTKTNHCDFCSRKDEVNCAHIEGGCKKYIRQYLESEMED